MTTKRLVDTKALAQEASISKNKEAYRLLEKNRGYRIGIGARANSPSSSLFVEAIINLSTESGEVNLKRFETILACLKILKSRAYSLTYDEGGSISCEKTALQDPDEEYQVIKSIIGATNI